MKYTVKITTNHCTGDYDSFEIEANEIDEAQSIATQEAYARGYDIEDIISVEPEQKYCPNCGCNSGENTENMIAGTAWNGLTENDGFCRCPDCNWYGHKDELTAQPKKPKTKQPTKGFTKITIYTVDCYQAYQMSEQGEGYSFHPWGGDTDYYKGETIKREHYQLPFACEWCKIKHGSYGLFDLNDNHYGLCTNQWGTGPAIVTARGIYPLKKIDDEITGKPSESDEYSVVQYETDDE